MVRLARYMGRNAAGLVAAGAVGCAESLPTPPPSGVPPITQVTVSPRSVTATSLGDTVRLTVTVRDSTGATRSDVAVTWSSSDVGVIKSLGDGTFRAEQVGTARAMASVGTLRDTVTVTVSQVVAAVTVTGPDTLVWVGGTLVLSASVSDARGNTVAAVPTWTVSDPGRAAIDTNGMVAGLDPGPFIARASVGPVGGTARLVTVTRYVAVDAGGCALDLDGRVLCWGPQLLPYWGINQYTPTLIQAGPFVTMGAGTFFGCGLDSDGVAYCWGRNNRKNLGNATAGDGSPIPMPVDGNYRFASLSVGPDKTCGVTLDGVGICWGFVYGGQLGRDTTGDAGLPAAVAGNHVWRMISARSNEGACGVTQSDSLFCWGDNGWGILGDSVPFQSSLPVPVMPAVPFRDVAVGSGPIYCGLTTDGTVICWGGYPGDNRAPAVVPLPGPATAVTAGEHACAVLADATAYCWRGDILGDGNYQFSWTPKEVAGSHLFTALSQGVWTTCGLATDARVYCWGDWTGDGTELIRYSPVLVVGQP